MIKATIPSSLGGIEFDCTVSRTKTFEAEVPQYPVESGFDVSDGIFYSPISLEVTATITETPVTWKNRHYGSNRIKKVTDQLETLFFKRELVTFITPDKVYKNMAITTLSIPKEEQSGNSIDITFTLLQVTVTSAGTVNISSDYEQGGSSNTDAGTTETTTEESAKKSGSILSKILGWLF